MSHNSRRTRTNSVFNRCNEIESLEIMNLVSSLITFQQFYFLDSIKNSSPKSTTAINYEHNQSETVSFNLKSSELFVPIKRQLSPVVSHNVPVTVGINDWLPLKRLASTETVSLPNSQKSSITNNITITPPTDLRSGGSPQSSLSENELGVGNPTSSKADGKSIITKLNAQSPSNSGEQNASSIAEIKPLVFFLDGHNSTPSFSDSFSISSLDSGGGPSGGGDSGGGPSGGGDGSVSWSGDSVEIVGGKIYLEVLDNYGQNRITSVTWTVPNSVKTQYYSNNQGVTNTGSNPTVSSGIGVTSSAFNGFWSASTGSRTVTGVAVVDNVTYTHSWTFEVVKPTATFEVKTPAASATVGGDPLLTNGTFGYATLADPEQTEVGIVYNVNDITLPVHSGGSGGTFGVIALIEATTTIVNHNTVSNTNVTHSLSTGQVLDNERGKTAPGDDGYFVFGDTRLLDMGQSGSFSVKPDFAQSSYITGTNETPVSVNSSITIKAYLVFRPSNGIIVALAHSDPFTLSGTLTWNSSNNQFIASNLSPAAPQNVSITNSLEFVGWNYYFTAAAAKANYSQPFS